MTPNTFTRWTVAAALAALLSTAWLLDGPSIAQTDADVASSVIDAQAAAQTAAQADAQAQARHPAQAQRAALPCPASQTVVATTGRAAP